MSTAEIAAKIQYHNAEALKYAAMLVDTKVKVDVKKQEIKTKAARCFTKKK